MWLYIKSYRFRGLFFRYLALCLTLSVLPLMTCATMIRSMYSDALTSEVGAVYQASIERTRNALDGIMAALRDMTFQLASGNNISYLITREEEPKPTYADIQRVDEVISSMSISESMYPFIASISLYTERNHYVYTSHNGAWNVRFYFDTSWLPVYETLERNSELHYDLRAATVGTTRAQIPYITVYRVLPIYGQRKLGALTIDLDPEMLKQYLLGSVVESTDVCLLDGRNRLLFSSQEVIQGISYEDYDEYATGVALEDGVSTLVSTASGDFQYSVAISAVTGWKLLFKVPAGQYMQKVDRLSASITMIIAVAIVLSFILSLTISAHVYAPFQDIHSTLANAPEPSKDRRELDSILTNIHHMMERNKELHGTLDSQVVQLKRAQNAAMQAQINPHFLYNTLDAINWLAKGLTGGENDASRMMSVLSRMLRYALETGSALVPLRDEAEHARAYVQIQQARLGDGIHVEFNIAAEALSCTMVKLTLQPLVENAVVHGLKPLGACGHIWIQAERIEEDQTEKLLLTVSDDGAGISQERLPELRREVERAFDTRDAHIGLANVHLRIRLIFGDKYGLSLYRRAPAGTRVEMRLPWIVFGKEGDAGADADDRG